MLQIGSIPLNPPYQRGTFNIEVFPVAIREKIVIKDFPDRAYRYLSDKSKGHVCYRLPVNQYTDQFARSLRQQFIEKTQAMGYRGYDIEYDRQFHQRSTYFYVRNERLDGNPVFLNVRVTDADESLPFPFEKGECVDGDRYSLSDRRNMLDMNTFFGLSSKWLSGSNLLMSAIGMFAEAVGCCRTFGLVDVKKPDVEKLYDKHAGFRQSQEFHQPVFFPGYTFAGSADSEPVDVKWKVLEWDQDVARGFAIRAQGYNLEAASPTSELTEPNA